MVRYNKKILITGILFVVTIVFIIIGFTYAFFTAGVEGNENVDESVVVTGTLRIEFSDTQILSLNNALPGASSVKTFIVKNTGTSPVAYNIRLTNVNNTFINNELVYEISSTNGGGSKTETIVPINDKNIVSEITVNPNVTQVYTIRIMFKETGINQNANQGAEFSGKLQIEETKKIKNQLLADNTALSDSTINFTGITGSGFYYTEDAATYGENGEKIYYFRGRVDNNWVSFGGYLWRIVRITSEGGVKLIYSGDGNTSSSGLVSNIAIFIWPMFGNEYYVGYTYNSSGYTGTQSDSYLKTVVDNWYTNNLTLYSEYLSNTATFCADRESKRINGSSIYFPASDRLIINKRPTYRCQNINQSIYTVSTETGNGYLTYPVATLSADEIYYAGLVFSSPTNTTSYIMDNATSIDWWTISPEEYSNWPYIFSVKTTGSLSYTGTDSEIGFRPAISLKSCITVLDGNGTKSNPYTLSNASC